MNINSLERCFNRAIQGSFQKKKLLLTFFTLAICTFLFVVSRALAHGANAWVTLFLIFVPIFLSFSVLFALGVVLIHIYFHERKNIKFSYFNILKNSFSSIIKSLHLTLPPILSYIILWVVFGLFILLKEIPHIGFIIGSILSFAPFLIIVSSLILVISNLIILFFASPFISLTSGNNFKLIKDIFKNFKFNIFSNILFFIIALLPSTVIIGFLSLAAEITKISYSLEKTSLSLGIKWFVIGMQFCAFLTPCVIFFFNFAAESFNSFKKTSGAN